MQDTPTPTNKQKKQQKKKTTTTFLLTLSTGILSLDVMTDILWHPIVLRFFCVCVIRVKYPGHIYIS